MSALRHPCDSSHGAPPLQLIGGLALSLLAGATVVQAVFLISLSRRVDDLARAGPEDRSRTARAASPPVGPVAGPRALPLAARSPLPSPGAVGAALHTAEGRRHLVQALALLEEEQKQAELGDRLQGDADRDRRIRERMTRIFGLSGPEQDALAEIHGDGERQRQGLLEEMRAGLRKADQTEEDLDLLRHRSNQRMRALLGERRLAQLRSAQIQ